MTHDDAFLQAILERPDDDAPRLLYADWLDERGDPRGEFIRVQCVRARQAEYDPRWWELIAREQELRSAYEKEWLGPVTGFLDGWSFWRGFLEGVVVRAPAFLE